MMNETMHSEAKSGKPTPAPPAGRRGRIARGLRKAANATRLLWFSARLTLGWQAVVLALAAAGVFAFGALTGQAWSVQDIFYTLTLIETVFFVILSMALLPREKEGQTLEVMLVSVRSAHRLLLVKFLPVCVFVLAAAIALTAGFYWLSGGFPVFRMLVVPYAVAATVGMFTLLLTTYFRNQYAAGVIAVVAALVASTAWIDPYESLHGEIVAVGQRGAQEEETRVEVDRRRGRRGGFFGDRRRGRRRRSRRPSPARSRGRDSAGPNLTMNRVLMLVLFGFLYDHTMRRMRRLELWMK